MAFDKWTELRKKVELDVGCGEIQFQPILDRMNELDAEEAGLKPAARAFVCPVCQEKSGDHAWNLATRRAYWGNEIVAVTEKHKDEATFVCPKCGDEVDGELVEEAPQS